MQASSAHPTCSNATRHAQHNHEPEQHLRPSPIASPLNRRGPHNVWPPRHASASTELSSLADPHEPTIVVKTPTGGLPACRLPRGVRTSFHSIARGHVDMASGCRRSTRRPRHRPTQAERVEASSRGTRSRPVAPLNYGSQTFLFRGLTFDVGFSLTHKLSKLNRPSHLIVRQDCINNECGCQIHHRSPAILLPPPEPGLTHRR
jgi:hypothetical protein